MHLLNSGWGASTRNCAHRQQLRLAAGPAMRAGHLTLPSSGGKPKQVRPAAPPHGTQDRRQLTPSAKELRSLLNVVSWSFALFTCAGICLSSSEEGRVGKVCCSTGRARRARYHIKKNN